MTLRTYVVPPEGSSIWTRPVGPSVMVFPMLRNQGGSNCRVVVRTFPELPSVLVTSLSTSMSRSEIRPEIGARTWSTWL